MRLIRLTRPSTVRILPLTAALVSALIGGALPPVSTAAHTPPVAHPTSITSFPTPTTRSGTVARETLTGTRHGLGAASTLGKPVVASVELSAGRRIGYVFDAAGRRTASRSVTLTAAEVDSAIRRFRKRGKTYYLLGWGALAGYWVKIAPGIAVVPATTWKTLVLVYRQTALDFETALGEPRRLEATMTPATETLMLGAVTSAPGLIHQWSSGLAAQTQVVVYPQHPLTQLSPLGNGAYWLGPSDIAADIAAYAPPLAFDSILVLWQPWDADDYVPSVGWGLGLPPGSYSNGAAYATITAPPRDASWWVTSMAYPGEVYVHEWLHGVIDYQTARGATIPDLHGAPTYGYTDRAGSWSRWYADLMQQRVRDPLSGTYVGIKYDVWKAGTPRTRP